MSLMKWTTTKVPKVVAVGGAIFYKAKLTQRWRDDPFCLAVTVRVILTVLSLTI